MDTIRIADTGTNKICIPYEIFNSITDPTETFISSSQN